MAKKARSTQITSSSRAGEAVDISSTDHTFVYPIQGLWIGTGGNVVVRLADDDADLVLKNVANGTIIPICPTVVRKTGTTAADMIGLL